MSLFSDHFTLSAEPSLNQVDDNREGCDGLRLLIETLPPERRPEWTAAIERIEEETRTKQRILDYLKESLEQLRFDMKYLLFDLEATRRERDNYRLRLETECD